MHLKICGMKYHDNIKAVAEMHPEYLGFIFYEGSPRCVSEALPPLPSTLKKVGVFVNASLAEVQANVSEHQLNAVQLHGEESAEYCAQLKAQLGTNTLEVIKAFAIKDHFNFNQLAPYLDVCDYFLFDTKGPQPGGNGYAFDWNILNQYPYTKPFFLSGGIGLDSLENLNDFLKSPKASYCHAIDVNSKFETAPGLKEVAALKTFKNYVIPR